MSRENLKGSEILRTTIDVASPYDIQNLELAKYVCAVLGKLYPDHMWKVVANVEGGCFTIFNLLLSAQLGYIVKLPATYSASELDVRIMRAGGEVLERFNMVRGAFKQSQYDGIMTPTGILQAQM